jgi:hypothetical protein
VLVVPLLLLLVLVLVVVLLVLRVLGLHHADPSKPPSNLHLITLDFDLNFV